MDQNVFSFGEQTPVAETAQEASELACLVGLLFFPQWGKGAEKTMHRANTVKDTHGCLVAFKYFQQVIQIFFFNCFIDRHRNLSTSKRLFPRIVKLEIWDKISKILKHKKEECKQMTHVNFISKSDVDFHGLRSFP